MNAKKSLQSHTPGPWRFLKTYPTDKSSYTVQAGDSPVETIARVLWHGSQAESNARLIASSPDLLAALEEAEITLKNYTEDGKESASGTLKMIRAVIAKAKGE